MSFNQHDNNGTIHLGNYEEFFILYMDKELSEAQMKMVDDFLVQNPDLQAEFDMLCGTKLPMETCSIDKEELMSGRMKLAAVDEALLLYIDNELPADQKKQVEKTIASDEDYGLQHRLLAQTKLDASEKLAYPYKKELYRAEEKRSVRVLPWMRMAAAAVVIAAAGLVWLGSSSTDTPAGTAPETADRGQVHTPSGKQSEDKQTVNAPEKAADAGSIQLEKDEMAAVPKQPVQKAGDVKIDLDLPQQVKEVIEQVDNDNEELFVRVENPAVLKTKTTIIEANTFTAAALPSVHAASSENINSNPVTSVLASRKTDVNAAEGGNNRDVAKGSVKGFLRKATRLIEKKTGIDPTNDGELLISVVAINLK